MESGDGEVGEQEAADIRAHVARVLRDMGNPEPPLDLDAVTDQLKLDFKYYSKTDLSLFDEVAHRVKVAGKLVIREPGRILDVVRKAKLNALWLPDGGRILMDDEVPTPKQRHIHAHEIVHSITPWHKTFLLGDNELTLDPRCQAMIEAEANYGAGQLLFLRERFAGEARDCELNWKNLQALKKRYRNTLTTTLWHAVEERDPDRPVLGLIGRHPRHPTIGGGTDSANVRHFIRSPAFRRFFPHVTADDVYGIVRRYVSFSKRGPCGAGSHPLIDANGERWEFVFHSFCNGYDLLTFGTISRRMPVIVGG
jgi:hypothetical protein